MNYLQFDFDVQDAGQIERLIALLAELGFEGFQEEDTSLLAFVPEHHFIADEFSRVIDMFTNISYIQTVVENINWNHKWEQGFEPVVIDDFVAIRAEFHQPITNVAHEIIITPKMSFGTGHHATTYLMVTQMKNLDFRGKSVLDFGTGTGILAILARKLGAQAVTAIDYDEWSIANARENIEKNDCSGILLEQSDKVPGNGNFNTILANINLHVITANLSSVATSSVTGATILLSGFLKENESELVARLQEAGLKYLSTMQRGDWIVVMAEKP